MTLTTMETHGIRIACEDPIEIWRAETLWTKEPGTIRWLATLQAGDVFYDVGANIGLYTILAARAVGHTGHVIACEPHQANVISLLRNIALNGLQDRVTVVSSPLSAAEGWAPFYYRSLTAGSSGSQLNRPLGEDGQAFAPVAVAWTYHTSLEALWGSRRGLAAPALLKIDVDGLEDVILAGLGRLRPRSVQVETRAWTRDAITAVLTAAGYRRTERHDTANGTQQIAAGIDPETLAYNLIFARAA